MSKRTIQKYMKHTCPKRACGQTWKTFLRNHVAEVWACDFLQVTDLFFRPLFAFFLIELKSRKVIHVNVTRSPTDSWVAQQQREATPYGEGPKYLIRDNDCKFGPQFARVATTSGIKVLRTPYRTPRANAVCERFLEEGFYVICYLNQGFTPLLIPEHLDSEGWLLVLRRASDVHPVNMAVLE